ncbi:MAG: DJ-1/PfpI family protein [Candidatus Diapherotrites archaeon]
MKILFVIAKENFRDEELFHPLKEVNKAGFEAVIASTEKGLCIGSISKTIEAEISLNKINSDEFDAVVFVGGAGSSIYFDNKKAHEIARKFHAENKPTCAICIAPSTLANAGLLKGKKATCYPSQKENLKAKGANYTETNVQVDGNIITADGPQSAKEFGKKIVEALSI